MSAIELIGISKKYGDLVAVAPTDLNIEEGELVTLLGPSGSGKSTILSMVAGLTAPTAGRIKIRGRDITDISPSQRNLGLVFQSYALFPHMSVYDNVAFPLSIRGVSKKDIADRVHQVLERVRLDGLSARRPSQLSGGQQQRVALARALIFKPDILLLDEPMGALDKKLREEVQLELRKLQRELGITTILVTHDQEEALSLSTRLVVLNQGQIQQIDTPRDVYEKPANRFVSEFIGTANILDGTASTRNGKTWLTLNNGVTLPSPLNGIAGPVNLIIRPEHLNVMDTSHPTGLDGKIIEAVYYGQTLHLYVEVDKDTVMVALCDTSSLSYRAGDHVKLDWASNDAWVMRAS